jgi:hypothetical protein
MHPNDLRLVSQEDGTGVLGGRLQIQPAHVDLEYGLLPETQPVQLQRLLADLQRVGQRHTRQLGTQSGRADPRKRRSDQDDGRLNVPDEAFLCESSAIRRPRRIYNRQCFPASVIPVRTRYAPPTRPWRGFVVPQMVLPSGGIDASQLCYHGRSPSGRAEYRRLPERQRLLDVGQAIGSGRELLRQDSVLLGVDTPSADTLVPRRARRTAVTLRSARRQLADGAEEVVLETQQAMQALQDSLGRAGPITVVADQAADDGHCAAHPGLIVLAIGAAGCGRRGAGANRGDALMNSLPLSVCHSRTAKRWGT